MRPTPLLGFVAYSGTGKTTLLRALIPLLRAAGLRIAAVKHTHHNFEIDQPGKDSHELRKAGAERVLVASGRRWALIVETGEGGDPRLEGLLEHLGGDLDLILVEGFKHEAIPKIELHRPALGRPLLHPGDRTVIAVATDRPLNPPPLIPALDLNDVPGIARFVLAWLGRRSA